MTNKIPSVVKSESQFRNLSSDPSSSALDEEIKRQDLEQSIAAHNTSDNLSGSYTVPVQNINKKEKKQPLPELAKLTNLKYKAFSPEDEQNTSTQSLK